MRLRSSVILAGALAAAAAMLAPGPAYAQGEAATLALSAAGAQGQPPAPPPGRSNEAQSARPYGGDGWGVKIGPIFSSFREARHEFDNHGGLEGGMFYGGGRRDMWGVVAEGLYAVKAQKEAGQATTDLHYLEVPILVRFNANPGDPDGRGVFLVGGEVFDLLLKAEQGGVDVKDNYAAVDFGLMLGGGVEFNRFSIEGRYIWGLKEILKAGITNAVTGGVKSRSFATLIGYRFN